MGYLNFNGQELKVTLLDRVKVRGGGIPPSGLGEMYLNVGAFSLILVPFVSILVGFCFAAFCRALMNPTGLYLFT